VDVLLLMQSKGEGGFETDVVFEGVWLFFLCFLFDMMFVE
jgi:hypothetical protein